MLVPNRICETTVSVGAGRRDGLPDEEFLEYHVERARGGVGWIGNEAWPLRSPLPPEAAEEYFPGASARRSASYERPDFPARLGMFCDAVHAEGAVAVFQLGHMNFTFGPSPVPALELYDWVPRELEASEIDFLVDVYVHAARRFCEGGADGIEIHCAHETIHHLFLSPATNHRRDAWGGDAAGRTRFLRQTLTRVRAAIGTGTALGIRISAQESRQGGYGLDDVVEMLTLILDSGTVDFLNLDIGHSWGHPSYVMPSYDLRAAHAPACRTVRDAVSVPVILSGGINDPLLGEQLLAAEVCDVVGMARASIADPAFPQKARQGRLQEIRRCIGCNRCVGEVIHGYTPSPLRRPVCSVNPVVGNEILWRERFRPAGVPGRVVVVGGGAAGLEAARVAAMRGHEVVVLEREEQLGGQVVLASRAPGRESFADFILYEQAELRRLGVDVRFGVDASAEQVLELDPTSVVCATGSVPAVPDVPGVDHPVVAQAWDVLAGKVKPGRRVAVVSTEDHMETPNVADYLAVHGCTVSIFHKWTGIAQEVDRYTAGAMLRRLEEAGVTIHTGLRARCFREGEIDFVSTITGAQRKFDAFDTVVLAYGSVPDVTLHRSLRDKVPVLHLAGSAWLPRQLHEATEHGMRIGLDV